MCFYRSDLDSETGSVSGEINENSPCIMIKSTRDLSNLPPTYGQTQDKNLPSYDEVTITSNNAKELSRILKLAIKESASKVFIDTLSSQIIFQNMISIAL